MITKWKIGSLLMWVAFLSVQGVAEDNPKGSETQRYSVYEYVTCAVYFRMLIGALKTNETDLSSLEDVYVDLMNRAITSGRQAARSDYSEIRAGCERLRFYKHHS